MLFRTGLFLIVFIVNKRLLRGDTVWLGRVGAFITGWTVGRLLQSIEGVK